MQSAVPEVGPDPRRRRLSAAAALLLASLVSPAAAQQAQTTEVAAEVPAGATRSMRLRNVPKDAQVAVVLQATGRLSVALLDAEDFKRYPAPKLPVFTATFDKRVTFSANVPAAGDYYIVVDNRHGDKPESVKIGLRARREASAPPAAGTPPETLREHRY